MSIRWALEPILGDRVKGWVGDLIDVLAIFGTLFGIATSLGLGVQQIAAGMEAIGIVDRADLTLLVVLIVVITFLATLSVVSGIGAGIKWLSNINLSLAGFVMVSMLLLGPTLFLLENFVESLGVYLGNVLNMTFDIGAYHGEAGHKWFADWTIFYWGWWIAWAPFVGVFIARISRGRTVREFIAGVLLVPSIVGFVWFSVMGGSGVYRQLFGAGDLVVDGEPYVVAGVGASGLVRPCPTPLVSGSQGCVEGYGAVLLSASDTTLTVDYRTPDGAQGRTLRTVEITRKG